MADTQKVLDGLDDGAKMRAGLIPWTQTLSLEDELVRCFFV